eukprot:SM000012S25277  [mRNA]  locus=s12:58618:62181:- [translate_table: standard]
MALCVSHRGLTMAAALATAVPILLLLVESLQVASGAGCPAAGGVGATGLHELSELPLHRSKEYGPMFLDENRGILLFSVENELWRLPVNLQSSQVFDSCNFSSRSYASDDDKTPFVLNKALGLAYVAFSRSGNPGLAIIDYSGSLNEMSEVLFNISSLNLDPGSPKCILFDSSTGRSLLGFETVGIAAVDASDPYHPFLIHWYPAVEGIFACQQLHRQGLFFAKKDSILTVVFVDLDATNSTLSSSSTFNVTSDGAMNVVVDPSEGMAYFGADNPPSYGKINVTSPLSTRQQEAYLLPAAGSFQAVLFDNYKRFIYWATASASLPLLRSPWGSQDFNITLQTLTTGVSFTSGQNLTVYSGVFAESTDLAFIAGTLLPLSAQCSNFCMHGNTHRIQACKLEQDELNLCLPKAELWYTCAADASDGQGVNVAAITTSACSTGNELCLTSQEVCSCQVSAKTTKAPPTSLLCDGSAQRGNSTQGTRALYPAVQCAVSSPPPSPPPPAAGPPPTGQNVSAPPTPQAPATYPPPDAPRSSVPPGSAVPPNPRPTTKPAPLPPPKVSPIPPGLLSPPPQSPGAPIPTPSSSPPEASPAASGPQSQVPAPAPSLPAGAMSPQPAPSPTAPSAAPPPESGNHSQVPVPQAPVPSTPGKSPPAPATGAADGQVWGMLATTALIIASVHMAVTYA